MREIKFRAYHNKLDIFRDLDFINFSRADFCGVWKTQPPEDLFSVVSTMGDLWNLEDVEIMQYTGLKDKNGLEIYEDDIISAFSDKNSIVVNFARVVFVGSSFCALELDTNTLFNLDELDDIQIVSNYFKSSATT